MIFFSSLVLLAWIYLIFFRGRFWWADQRLGGAETLIKWPSILAVIPARDEQDTINQTVTSLLQQKYPGHLNVVVVDDNSRDKTVDRAGSDPRLHIVSGKPLIKNWTGKLWALHQGIEEGLKKIGNTDYLLLTDADIFHSPENVKNLVYKAETENLDLVSLMVKLNVRIFWEKMLIPAFVFFFQKLYPFIWVNSPDNNTAAAAGGCMLINRKSLAVAGGVNAVHQQLIDDCAIAKLLKRQGFKIWLGLSDDTVSLRQYHQLSEIWNMVARTAFVQLNYSLLLVQLCVVAMLVIYLAPVLLVLFAFYFSNTYALMLSGGAWVLMITSYLPMLKYYQISVLWALFLPVQALLYLSMTISSAWRHLHGQGGSWKGRTYCADQKRVDGVIEE